MRVAASFITLLLVSAVVSAKKKKQKKENLFREEQQILSKRICRATVTLSYVINLFAFKSRAVANRT